MRTANIRRTTAETDIRLTLNLDGTGACEIATGVGFLDHMLTLFARHGRFDLTVSCKGDTNVDDHHSVEDIGICLGDAFARALSDMRGITRYGSMMLPMDESLILCAVDLSGRGGLTMDVRFPTEKIGSFDTQLVREFFEALSRRGNMTLHLKMLSGENSHHIAEACFKTAARALRQAVRMDPDCSGEIPSTKGTLV